MADVEHPALRRERETALAREEIRRQGVVLQLGVLVAWLGASLALASIASLFFSYGASLLAVAGAFSGVLAPAAIAGGRAINTELSQRRLKLYRLDDDDLSGLSTKMRELLLETRMARLAVEGWDADEEDAVQAVYGWLGTFDKLPESDRQLVASLGVTPDPVREVFFSDLSAERPRGGLSAEQQRSVLRQLETFERAILASSGNPYR
jgi:hypothetical protein